MGFFAGQGRRGELRRARPRRVASLSATAAFDALHVWQRDTARPGWRGFEPHVTPAAREAEAAHSPAMARAGRDADDAAVAVDCPARPARARLRARRAGRVVDRLAPGDDAANRAIPADCARSRCRPRPSRGPISKWKRPWRWSELPIAAGQRVVEIGCAPGGASQALLAHGLERDRHRSGPSRSARAGPSATSRTFKSAAPTCGGASFAASPGWRPT